MAVDTRTKFLLSIEEECMCSLDDGAGACSVGPVLGAFMAEVRKEAPNLRGHAGLFNAYGRIYLDFGDHIELAALECDSPLYLALAVEAQHELAARALARMRERGICLRLANNNHSGLLHPATETWGTHENYLVSRRPTSFGDLILPFLVSRIYGGSGGIRYPDGEFVASVRSEFMQLPDGGETTGSRAIHSTCREEHHMPASVELYRYHLILGDGHRSQFNLSLQAGATALALKVVEHDPELPERLAEVKRPEDPDKWVTLLQDFNRLARSGEPPRVDPQVVAIQRIYLEAATEWASRLYDGPDWIPVILHAWRATLDAYESMDLAWLAQRLDAFIKYRLFSAVLAESGRTWAGISQPAMSELTLIDQSYHSFGDPHSVFGTLERRGLLDHRVGDPIEPGREPEPYVPDTSTRARARARFIRQNQDQREHLVVDWGGAFDLRSNTRWDLADPFAADLLDIRPGDSARPVAGSAELRALERRRLRRAAASANPLRDVQ